MITFSMNGEAVDVDVDPVTPILWVVRETLGMTGERIRELPIANHQFAVS